MKLEIHSLEETKELARKIAAQIDKTPVIILLDGDLGAGKTTWTKAFAKALGIKATVNSPTFTIMKEYKLPDGTPFHHIDAYRLEGISQDLGFEEQFEDGITVIEWSDFIADQLPDEYLKLSIEEGIDENRLFTIEGKGELTNKVLKEVAA